MNIEYVNLRSMKYLLSGYKDVMTSTSTKMSGGVFMARTFRQILEDLKSVCSIEIYKVSARKWQVTFIETDENSYNVEDDNLFLSPANYDLKHITEQVEIYQYSPMFGAKLESVCKGELEQYPEFFRVTDEYDKEVTQEELKAMMVKSSQN